MILPCYDGSSDAQAAVDHAGELMSGEPATPPPPPGARPAGN